LLSEEELEVDGGEELWGASAWGGSPVCSDKDSDVPCSELIERDFLQFSEIRLWNRRFIE
jgi:hypothetical protein